MHPMLNIAVRAARKAGTFIARSFEDLDSVEAEVKGQNDLVTNVDREAERLIIETIQRSYPQHSFIGEECGQITGEQDDYQWVIDPLDGTTNFVKGIPHFCVSIALRVNGKTEQAVIYDPIRDELFTATRGSGAQFNGKRIRVARNRDINGTVLATGFPFRQKQHTDTYLAIFKALFDEAGDVRRAGAAALDLAYVASGRLDGFFELGLKPWDVLAGELLIREAGGIATDFAGGHNHTISGNIVTANPKVLQAMLGKIRPYLTPAISK